MRKPTTLVSDQGGCNVARTVTEAGYYLDILGLRRIGMCVAKTNTLISSAITAQLICVFVFAYACCSYLCMLAK